MKNSFPSLADVEEQDQKTTSTGDILFMRFHSFERHVWKAEVSQQTDSESCGDCGNIPGKLANPGNFLWISCLLTELESAKNTQDLICNSLLERRNRTWGLTEWLIGLPKLRKESWKMWQDLHTMWKSKDQ